MKTQVFKRLILLVTLLACTWTLSSYIVPPYGKGLKGFYWENADSIVAFGTQNNIH